MEFKERTLDNGLVVIGEVNSLAQSAGVGFFAKTGSRDETPEISGVSHFLEHMMFKGTGDISALQVNEAFDKIGAQYNAFTSEENTVYYAAVLPEYLNDAANLWVKLMRPRLGDDDFNMEKNVIKEEIAMYKDHPLFDVIDKCRSLHFGNHPCGNSVLGTTESIDALSAEQMREYFNRRYAPNNLTAAVAGNFDFDSVCKILENGSSSWTPADAGRKKEYFGGTLKKQSLQNEKLVRQHICLMTPSVAFEDERSYAATLLGMIVGDDTGSRLYWELVDTAIAEDASLGCDAMDGVGLFYCYIKTSPDSVDKVMKIVNKIFNDVTKNGVNENELQKAKNKLLSNITIKNEVPMGRLMELGMNWGYLRRYREIAEVVEKIKAITVGDVADLLGEFGLDKFTQVSIGPMA